MQPERRENVPLFAVRIVKERYERRAVGVVLDGRDLGGNAVLVALEVDNTVFLSSGAATVVLNRVPGVMGLYLLIAIGYLLYDSVSKNGIAFDASVSLTYAFFPLEV